MAEALTLEGVHKTYLQGGKALEVLRDVNISIAPGEAVALIGPSGSGKTTLLQIAGLLDRPSGGTVILGGKDASRASEAVRTAFRGQSLGFVYQFHHLLAEFSALENAMMPLLIAGRPKRQAKEKAAALLESVGLGARLDHRPARLSGGEQQRVAIARALAGEPALLLADEPTGNLDPDTAEDVFTLLLETARSAKAALLIATHNLELARRMHRIVRLEHGTLLPATDA